MLVCLVELNHAVSLRRDANFLKFIINPEASVRERHTGAVLRGMRVEWQSRD
jgi:hypothetical protein